MQRACQALPCMPVQQERVGAGLHQQCAPHFSPLTSLFPSLPLSAAAPSLSLPARPARRALACRETSRTWLAMRRTAPPSHYRK